MYVSGLKGGRGRDRGREKGKGQGQGQGRGRKLTFVFQGDDRSRGGRHSGAPPMPPVHYVTLQQAPAFRFICIFLSNPYSARRVPSDTARIPSTFSFFRD